MLACGVCLFGCGKGVRVTVAAAGRHSKGALEDRGGVSFYSLTSLNISFHIDVGRRREDDHRRPYTTHYFSSRLPPMFRNR